METQKFPIIKFKGKTVRSSILKGLYFYIFP